MQKIKDLYRALVANEHVMRVAHTFWQAAGGVLVAQLLTAGSTSDVKAVIAVAVATGLAALKAALLAGRL